MRIVPISLLTASIFAVVGVEWIALALAVVALAAAGYACASQLRLQRKVQEIAHEKVREAHDVIEESAALELNLQQPMADD